MAVDATRAGLQRVLDALTAPETARPVGLDEALRETWLELWYQPKIDIRKRCLAGAEALARIRHPEQGILMPASFLPGVDDDAMARLTEHALLSALRDWEKFDEAGFNLRLSINVPVNLLERVPVSTIVNENKPKSEYWPGLIVEVTEDQIVRDVKKSQEIALELKASGISVAIDDFGAGYSSFSSLREISFIELKLNCSFVKNCAIDATNAAICQTAIDLAHRFGSAAVAEGIETMADLQAMQIMGCDFAQGHLLARPMPLPDFIGLLNQRLNKTRPAPQAKAAPLPEVAPDNEPPLAASA
jgi:EAL domain-containing protein (putative c-di-GMP-specific phosphodiesterase class I)